MSLTIIVYKDNNKVCDGRIHADTLPSSILMITFETFASVLMYFLGGDWKIFCFECLTVRVLTYTIDVCRIRQILDWGICNSRLARCVDFWGLLTQVSQTSTTVLADGPGRPVRFAAHRQSLSSNFLYHSRIVLSVGGSGPKPPLQRHNWLSFSKFQDKERFLTLCPRHVSSRLPPSGKTCKYAKTLITLANFERFSTYRYVPCAVHILVAALPSSEVPELLMNYPVDCVVVVIMYCGFIFSACWRVTQGRRCLECCRVTNPNEQVSPLPTSRHVVLFFSDCQTTRNY
jgi:hypothetical protein